MSLKLYVISQMDAQPVLPLQRMLATIARAPDKVGFPSLPAKASMIACMVLSKDLLSSAFPVNK